MSCHFFKMDDMQFMIEADTDKIYISVQDGWFEVKDMLKLSLVRVETGEITYEKHIANSG